MSLLLSPSRLTGVILSALAAAATAQTHKIAAPERVTRAVGIYEYTGELPKPNAARLVPVTLFINGHLEDAGVYLSRPAPFALQSGSVYSVERAGDSLGTLDLDLARNVVTRRSAADDAPLTAWYGYGRFQPPAPPAPPKALKASTSPGKIVSTSGTEDNDERPTLLRREDAAPAATAPGKPSATSSGASAPAVDDDPERPTLRRRDPVEETKRKKEKPGGYVSGPEGSLNDDPNRPSMRRGVPAAQMMAAQLDGAPPVATLHQIVAVSDAASHEPHLFTREWESATEHAQALAELQTLARTRITAYLAANHLGMTAPVKPTVPSRGATRRAVKTMASPLVLNGEDLRAYTLSYGGLPTFVYTAASPIHEGGEADVTVYVTVVAQRLPSGELQVALATTTDAVHLDRVPWLRPIDAVDVDGSHRASLLFELRAQNSRQFGLYRLVTAQAEQTFLSGILQ